MPRSEALAGLVALDEVLVEEDRLGIGQWLRWIGLAFIPSSLMLGVTTHISTDVAAVPLLWIVPLALSQIRPGGTLCINAIHTSPIPEMPYSLLWQERTIRTVANSPPM